MSNYLAGLREIPGVLGAVLFDATDACLEHVLSPPYDPDLFLLALNELRAGLQATAGLEAADPVSFWVQGEGGSIVLRFLGGSTLGVLASTAVNPAMLTVGFNVVERRIRGELSRPPAPMASVPPPALSQPPPASPARPSPGGQAIGAPVVEKLVGLLAKQIGPVARLVVREGLAAVAATPETLDTARYKDFIRYLTTQISEPERAARFLDDVRSFTAEAGKKK